MKLFCRGPKCNWALPQKKFGREKYDGLVQDIINDLELEKNVR